MFQKVKFSNRHFSSFQAIRCLIDKPKIEISHFHLQVEPYLYLGMGQVSLYDEEGKIFFSRGVDLNDTIILDPWVK